MKKYLIMLGSLCLFAVTYPYDGSAGASLNRSDTAGEYNRLIEVSDKAISSGDSQAKDEAIDGIEDFLTVVEEYRIVSSPGATRHLNKFEKDLEMKLEELKEMK